MSQLEIYRLVVAVMSIGFCSRAYHHAKAGSTSLTTFYAVGWLGLLMASDELWA